MTGGGGVFDQVFSTASFTAAAGIERLTLQGAANINATGRDGQADELVGNSGNNILNGLGGNDTLTGGPGQDTFRFDTALGAATNFDQIIGFLAVDDTIELYNAVFTALGATVGPLAASMFQLGAAANDAFDRIIYNNATGTLSYDADGNGGGAAIQFASLTGVPVVTFNDFIVGQWKKRGLDVRLGWTQEMYAGAFKGRQPEGILLDEWEQIILAALSRKRPVSE